MDFSSSASDFPAKSPTLDSIHRAAIDLVGGELLQGSGFEDEKPDSDFEFDWSLPTDRSTGGIQ